MALRHVPVLAEEARTLWVGQRLRGMRLVGRGSALTSPGSLVLPLLAANLRRADEIAAALHARGFSLEVLAEDKPRRPPAAQRALMWCGAAILALVLAGVTLARIGSPNALPVPWLQGLLTWVATHA
jgi:energy-coupling factor transporter transmembrane protein EcfT